MVSLLWITQANLLHIFSPLRAIVPPFFQRKPIQANVPSLSGVLLPPDSVATMDISDPLLSIRLNFSGYATLYLSLPLQDLTGSPQLPESCLLIAYRPLLHREGLWVLLPISSPEISNFANRTVARPFQYPDIQFSIWFTFTMLAWFVVLLSAPLPCRLDWL